MSSLHVGIAMKYAKNQYTEANWLNFYTSLSLLFEMEDLLNTKLKEYEKENLRLRVISFDSVPVNNEGEGRK